MTGMDTAAMMPSIMSGSLIRATPPSALMSAGTRSSAITATAPASSAILACSGVTTSMITPPLSMSAMPRFTRSVPVPGAGAAPAAEPPAELPGLPVLAGELWTDTGTSLSAAVGLISMVGGPPAAPLYGRSARQPGAPRRGGLVAAPGHQRVVYLEELRRAGTARQPEQPDQPAPPRGAGRGHRAVVETAGQEDLVRRGLGLGQQFRGAGPAGQRGAEVGLAEGRPQGPGQVALGQFLVPRRGRPGVVRGAGYQQAGGRVEEPGGGQLQRHGTAPQQGRVERGAGRVQPGVQPVQAAGPPGDVHPDQQRHRDDDDDPGHRVRTPTTSSAPSRTVS